MLLLNQLMCVFHIVHSKYVRQWKMEFTFVRDVCEFNQILSDRLYKQVFECRLKKDAS
jgi:hypothetical protein